MSNWIRSREFPRAQLVRWLDGSGSPAALPLSLEQAIIRSHPQVVALVEAARDAKVCIMREGELCARHSGALRAALAPWEETTND
jgi:hypothetical protein